MKVFYHNDLDGKCAAHIILHYAGEHITGIESFPIEYGMDFPFHLIRSEEAVYILDYSIEPDEMDRLLGITSEVIWIDHHRTAVEKYQDYPLELMGLRQISGKPDDLPPPMSGCELAYRWVWHHILVKGSHNQEDTPEYIRLVGDRDTWTWKYGQRTKYFYAGVEAEEMEPTSPIWDVLRADADANTNQKIGEIVMVGGYIQRYKDKTQQRYIRENGFWVDWEGYHCYAICGQYNSEPFEVVVPEADAWLAFRYMPDGYWTVSLYSTEIDVSDIAKKYQYRGKRGGGHTGAAGFQCEFPPFLTIGSDVPCPR